MKDLKEYESVKRWLNQVFADGIRSEETEKLYLHVLNRFSEFTKKDPDQLIEERREHLRSQDEFVRRQHEELLTKFRNHIENEGLARSSVATFHGVLKSFYKYNYVELESKRPKTWAATKRKVPTPEELAKMVDVTSNNRDKTIIICLAQSGISIKDFLGITYGMIKPELEKGIVPLHLDMRRSKVMKEYDTFLGEDSIDQIKLYLEEEKPKTASSELFTISKRAVEYIVKDASVVAGLKPHVTPHKLRSFFNTYLTLSFHGFQSQHIPIVDYWMGHVLPYGGAYLVPPVEEQRQIYQVHENAISISDRKRESFQIYQAYRSLVEKHGEEEARKILGGVIKT